MLWLPDKSPYLIINLSICIIVSITNILMAFLIYLQRYILNFITHKNSIQFIYIEIVRTYTINANKKLCKEKIK